MNEENRIRLYLDTSIPSAFYDTSKPLRQLITQKWFENDSIFYELFISVITIEEIEKIKNEIKKNNISELVVNHILKFLNCLKIQKIWQLNT
ncbi:MAG: hypothetical protein HQK65_20865 [Desulfamplus sp.]|nr:hypothetical protein [Desulfamplus sp.]